MGPIIFLQVEFLGQTYRLAVALLFERQLSDQTNSAPSLNRLRGQTGTVRNPTQVLPVAVVIDV